MAVHRTDIERALEEIASQEEGMRFQGLAVVLGKQRWPELIARQRKKDHGLDAYAPANLTLERISKGLAASITPTLNKISDDARKAKKNFPDLGMLLFVTSAKVGNADRRLWERTIQKDHSVELHIIEREEIITLLMMPENTSLCASFLYIQTAAEPQLADLIARTRRAADAVTDGWASKTKGHPLIELTAVRLDPDGAESADVLSLEQIDQALSQSRRIVLEGPAGRGKTTTLIQLAQRTRTACTPFIVELSAWTSSSRGILDYIAGLPAFQAEALMPVDLARVQQIEPFLFLLNGWNEITESNSLQAHDALRELERHFPSAGIIIATRTHHLTPPLPGALRLRLLRLRTLQRTAYLTARLGARVTELRSRIDADPSLDELTRTPLILSEVASLFEAGAEIPSTKLRVLDRILLLQEQRDEHRNALQAVPIFGLQSDYLKALAIEMTRRGAVALPQSDSRAVVARVAREFLDRGQIEAVGAPAILATLTAHHVLERVDYPRPAFQFEHQQLQEYFGALDVRSRLFDLRKDDRDAIVHFTAFYMNDPAWAEPLRMIAEALAEQTGDDETDKRNILAGRQLVEMALVLDPVFAGELAQLCGAAVWNEVRAAVGERFRSVYAIRDDCYRLNAIAAMLATGADDFGDIIEPLLSGQDRQTRLRTYRLWPDIQVSSLGPNWRERVRGWSDEARADFVSELLHQRVDSEVAVFAAEDNDIAVKKAAVSGLIRSGSDDALTRVLESMDALTFEDVARHSADRMPTALRTRTIAAMRNFIARTTDHSARLRTALDLIDLGEAGLDAVLKDTMAALTSSDMRGLDSHFIRPAVNYLSRVAPAWVNEWVTRRVAEGALSEHDYWLKFVTYIPDSLAESSLLRLEAENLECTNLDGIIAVTAAHRDAEFARRVFLKLRELRRKVDLGPHQRHDLDRQVRRQLVTLFRRFPDDVAVGGILSSVSSGDPLDIKVAAELLSRVARPEAEPLRIADADLKARLRAYLKGSVALVLLQEDFNGEEKANLASSIAQLGFPEDMADLLTLIRADIERMRRGRAALASGDRGPLGNGGIMSYARWHIAAVMHLGVANAEQVLIDLLSEPEYLSDAAAAMAREFVPEPNRSFYQTLRYDLIWAAREGRIPRLGDDHRRARFAAALNVEIRRTREQERDGKPAASLKDLASALAAVDALGSAAAVVDVISLPGHWDQYILLNAAERLLMAGVDLPAATVFALVDSVLERSEKWMPDSDRYLLSRILALCPFVHDPAAGIAKMREVLGERRIRRYELREIVVALGESRLDAAADLLYELSSDARTFEYCEAEIVNALAALDTPRSRDLLMGIVDPDIQGIALTHPLRREDVLALKLAELARRRPELERRLWELCERDLPDRNRQLLSKLLGSLGTPEALAANLNLIDDAKSSPVPQGIWDQLRNAFVERRPYGQSNFFFFENSRASNDLRVRLFRMAVEDEKRRRSAFRLLCKIEEWRLEHGRPTSEMRHPDLSSGQSWPPTDHFPVPEESAVPDRT